MHENIDPHWALLKLMVYPEALSDQDRSDLKAYFLADPDKVIGDIKKNVIAVRAYDQLTRLGLNDCAAVIKDLRDQECLRIKNALNWIDKLSRFLEEQGTGFIFPKALMHYPDMGHDIDLLLLGRSLDIDQVILGAFPGKVLKNSFVNVLAGKTGCILEGCSSPLEIHHGRTGRLGEVRGYVTTMIKNKRTITVSGFELAVLSVEDQLINGLLQRLYSHMYFRLTDVVEALKLIRTKDLDWDYTLGTARSLGISDGLGYFIAFCKAINKKIGRELLSLERLDNKLPIPKVKGPFFQGGVIRYPPFSVNALIMPPFFMNNLFCPMKDGAA